MVSNIDFNKEIYSFGSVRLAADQYKKFAVITIDAQCDPYIKCKFEDCVVDEDLLKKEFANYVLALNIKRGL